MRIIKYRGIDENGCWHVGWLAGTNDGFIYIIENDEGWTDDGFHDDDFSGCHKVLEKTIGQFTGLFDKNGEEIYEGDIVEYDWYIIGDKPAYRVKKQVVFDDMGARVGDDKIRNCTNVKVVGNIHDNPELLKKETL